MAADRPAITFDSFDVPGPVVKALAGAGIVTPTSIQARTLPDTMAGKDVLGRGQTGSGKTYAFLVPVASRLAAETRRPAQGRPRALVLVPTRELATQVEAALAVIGAPLGLRWVTIFGGVSERPQISALRAGVDVVIACPGRLAALVADGHARLDGVEITVLDEADHMADMGFLPQVRKLLAQTPRTGQRLLFSATLDKEVDGLAREFMRRPSVHEVDTIGAPVKMSHYALQVESSELLPVLVDLAATPDRTLVFTRTKQSAKRLTKQLRAAGVNAVELHGNLAQNARTNNLKAFAEGRASTLVATDIAARGIHVDDVMLVIHAQPPVEHKAYLHRSGRTARAGAEGAVITLFTAEQRGDVQQLARRARIQPAFHTVRSTSPLLAELAPGPRILEPQPVATPATNTRVPQQGERRASGRRPRRRGESATVDRAHGSGTPQAHGEGAKASSGGRSRRRSGSHDGTTASRDTTTRSSRTATTVYTTRTGGVESFSRRSRVGR